MSIRDKFILMSILSVCGLVRKWEIENGINSIRLSFRRSDQETSCCSLPMGFAKPDRIPVIFSVSKGSSQSCAGSLVR